MAGAMVVATIALVANAFAAYRMMKAVMGLKEKVEPLLPQVQETLVAAAGTLRAATEQLHETGSRAQQFLDAAQMQMEELGRTREDVSERLKIQMERAELVLDDTLSRVQDVVGTVHHGVIRPVKEVTGVLNGVKTAFSTFLQNRRPAVDRATQDEEMFI